MKSDTANFDIRKFTLEDGHRFAKRISAEQALSTLPPFDVMGEIYRNVFMIYQRKFQKVVDGMAGKSKEAKALGDICKSLNISDTNFKDKTVIDLIARLRALDMVKRPS